MTQQSEVTESEFDSRHNSVICYLNLHVWKYRYGFSYNHTIIS